MIFKYKFLYPNPNYISSFTYFPMVLKTDDITIRLPKSNHTNTKEEEFRLLVDYVGVIKEIYDDTKLHEDVAS